VTLAVVVFLVSCAGSWAARRMPVTRPRPVRGSVAGGAGLSPGVAEWLAAAELRLRPGPALWLWAGGTALAGLSGLVFGAGWGAVLGVVGLVGPPGVVFARRHRRDRRLADALPDALDRLAADLRSGGSLLAALGGVAAGPSPLAADMGRISDRVAAGTSLAGSLAAWPGDRPLPVVAAVAAALEVAATVGGRSAPALEGLAGGLRDQRDTTQEAAALSAQARVSALVVGLAPLGSVGLSLLADRRVPATLVESGPGRICLVAGLGMDALAFAWMRRVMGAGR
jgi:tight adherence protein B